MKDILLALCILAAFALGALPMRRLDRFLERNREAIGRKEGAPAELPGAEPGARARRNRAFGFACPGAWRRSGFLPLRHRS